MSGVQATPGQVRFFLAARGVAPGQSLRTGALKVTSNGSELPVRVETVVDSTVDRPARAVVIAVDTSGSMAGGSIAAARTAALEYAGALPADVQLGLVSFADRANVQLAPTYDRTAFVAAVSRLNAKGGTALYDAVTMSATLLAGEYLERHIVVLSDGADTASTAQPKDVARAVSKPHRIPVDVVAFGDGGAAASELADTAGARVVPATDAGQLREAFRVLAGGFAAPVLVTVTVPVELAGPGALRLAIDTGTGLSTVDVPVTFRPDPAAVPAAAPVRVTGPPSWLLMAVLVSVAVAVAVGGFLLAYRIAGRSAIRGRLRQLERFTVDRVPSSIAPQPAPQDKPTNVFVRTALAVSQRAVERQGQQSRIEFELDRAGLDLRPAEWQLLRAGTSLGLAVLLAWIFPWWLGVPLGLIGGWLLTGLYRNSRAQRRAARFAELLPEALQLVVGAIRSGFSLAQAFDALVREGPEPVASELGRALAETRLGGELEDALDRAAARNGSADLTWLVMAIRIQREVGGNLSEVLQTAVETMRERERINRHVRGLSAEGRISAYVLIAMPIVLAGWLFAFRGEYLRPLYTEPLGIVMLCVASIMVAVGAFWMSRMVKVDV